MDNSFEDIKQLIADGKTRQAIEQLLQLTQQTKYHNEIVQYSAKFKEHEKIWRRQLITREEFDVKMSRIQLSLLKVIDEMVLPDDAPPEKSSITEGFSTLLVEIMLEGELSDFNQTRRENLIRTTAAILQIDRQLVKIRKVISGSIRIIMELPVHKAMELINLIRERDDRLAGFSNEFKVISIEIMNAESQDQPQADQPKGKKRRPLWTYITAAAVIIGILGSTAEILNFINIIPNGPGQAGNTVTVLVHGPRGKDDKILPGRGIVYLIYGNAKASEQINDKGVANFNQVPERFFEPTAKVEVLFEDPEGEPYRATRPDSLYALEKGQYIALEVELLGMEQVSGIVKDFETGDPVAGVKVRIHAGLEATTNEYGEFTLDIPEGERRPFITIRAYKDGYQNYELKDVPTTTDQEIIIGLKPR
jgi:hypothetical protein